MKIVKTEGCIVSGVDIDNKSIDILEDEKKKQYYQQIIK